MEDLIDSIFGGLHGVAIGDSLGAPFEFTRSTPKIPYTGIITDITVKVRFQFCAMIILPGSITDDTEMTIQLLKSILQSGKYVEDDVIKNYLDWANLKNTPLGKNTRKLMKGVTTTKGFRNRQKKVDTSEVESNGSLMRCFPLLLLGSLDKVLKASDKDCTLTNDNNVNRECSRIYLTIGHWLIDGGDLELEVEEKSVLKAIKKAQSGIIVDVSENKGWVVHALYVAIITFLNVNSFQEGMDYIAEHFIEGDTDTIMAITGGLLGLRFGYSQMFYEKKTSINLDKIYNYFNSQNENNTERPIFTKELLAKLTKQIQLLSL
jgi:ADP-ribosyl-[dinitrogen reductase] hydrolase